MPKTIAPPKSKQLNVRIPDLTLKQIDRIATATGMSQSKIIIMAVERLAADLKTRS
jgi:predicted DNA binding CopG/RHH family protein